MFRRTTCIIGDLPKITGSGGKLGDSAVIGESALRTDRIGMVFNAG
jgi:hypothetical protein